MTATIKSSPTRTPEQLSAAVTQLVDAKEIEELDILWRHPAGDIFIGPLPPDLNVDYQSMGTALFWLNLDHMDPGRS